MLIVGTGGFALESMEILLQQEYKGEVSFFNNVQPDFSFGPGLLEGCRVLHSNSELSAYFGSQPEFILGIGNPKHRQNLYELMTAHGGRAASLVSPKAVIGCINNTIKTATNIMSGVIITSNVRVKTGALINLSCTVGHDSVIGEFSEICPHVTISGHCTIGPHVFIGSGATLLPGVTVGEHAVIAAGAVVIKDVAPYTMVAGNPGVVKKQLS